MKINYCSYKHTISKNNGIYKCHKCRVTKRTTVKCVKCQTEFVIPTRNLKENKLHFCSVDCSTRYQSALYEEERNNGKKCSRCGLVKSIKDFSRAAIGKKNPRYNKIYQYCNRCKNEYGQTYRNRIVIS
jgi:hypothetical protein